MDQFLRLLHRRTRAATTGALLLGDRYQGISTLGLAVRSLRRECAGAVCRVGLDGQDHGLDKNAARRRHADLIAGLDLSQFVPELGLANQRVLVLRNRIYSAVATVHVAALPQTDLHKGVKENKHANLYR